MQASDPSPKTALSAFTDLWPYLAGLIIVAIVGGIVIMVFRRSFLSKHTAEADESLMGALRRMRDSGEISHEEYEQSMRSMAHRVAARLGKPVEPPADHASKAAAPRIPTPPSPRVSGAPVAKPPAPPARPPAPPAPDDFPPLTELPPGP